MGERFALKSALRERRLTVGSWLHFGNADVAELLADCGFDWLVVDMEHSATTVRQAQDCFRAIQGRGRAALCRVAANDVTLIKHAMDAGADGILVPRINSAAEARAAVQAAKYPPAGDRGVGLWRAQRYGLGFDEYRRWLETEAVVIVQIEHIDGIAALPDILAVEGVDGFTVGPYDLSASLGSPGDFQNPRFLEAMQAVDEVARSGATAAGFHVVQPDARVVSEKMAAGYTFLVLSSDMVFLTSIARQTLDASLASVSATMDARA